LISIASTIQAKAEDKSGEELNELNDEAMRRRQSLEVTMLP
jgi:hypothetical protein